jgi:DNA-binding response OmpR family regulator
VLSIAPSHKQEYAVASSPSARRERHSIFLFNDDPALGDAIKEYLIAKAVEVILVHDSTVAVGVIETRREMDLLMTRIATAEGSPRTVVLLVRSLAQRVGFVFMTGRPQLIDAGLECRDRAFVRPVDLAQEICDRLGD